VDGDLHITGGVSGKGSIFCTGDVTIDDASGFSTDNVQAIVADGSITITGGNGQSSRDNSFFTGVLFSHGGMNLSNVTVVGSVVNNSPTPNSTLELNNVGLLSSPEVVSFDFGVPMNYEERFDFDGGDNVIHFIASAEDYKGQYSPETDQFESAGQGSLTLRLYEVGDVGSHHDEPILFGTFNNAQELFTAMTDPTTNLHWNPPQGSQSLEANIAEFYTKFNDAITDLDALYQETKQESLTRGEFTLEPNQFVPFEDRVRVIWTKERRL
jgi:hypothetical protein